MKTALIIGGGFAGCAMAHQFELQGGWKTTLVETAPFLGGGCKTFFLGGHPYTFGPRHLITDMVHVYEYLNDIVPLRRCNEHLFWTYVEQDERFYHYPIHMDDIRSMPDAEKILAEMEAAPGAEGASNLREYWVNSVGPTLYHKFIHDYNKKMWMVSDPAEIDHNVKNWSPKGPNIATGPKEVFHGALSCYPWAKNGYDDYFAKTTASSDLTVMLNTKVSRYDIKNKTVELNGETRKFDVIVSSIPPDILFDFAYGELKFIGRDFFPIVLPIEEAFPENVFFNYYANQHPVTRVVEYKKLTLHKSPTTLIGVEVPSLSNRLYPLPIDSEVEKANQYLSEMPDGVFSTGRAGRYDYIRSIDHAIDDAMTVAMELRG